MKLTTLSVCGIILATALGGNVQQAFATDYSSATEAQSEGKIEFEDADNTILDPSNPEVEVVPSLPANTNKGDLVLQYVSDFDFGKHQKTLNEFTTFALPDTVTGTADETNTKYNVPLFVSTKDMRTDRGNGWTLSVTASNFYSVANADESYSGGTELKGGEVVFTNANYSQSDEFSPIINDKAASTDLANGLVLTPNQELVVANADASKNQGLGSYSLALGNLVDDNGSQKVNGVTFRMPAKTAVDTAEYQATFDWELKADLSAFE